MSDHGKRFDNKLTRRRFLQLTGGTVAGAYLMGLPGFAQDAGGLLTLPDTGAQIPANRLTFRLVDSNDVKKLYWNAFGPAYEAKHSNVTFSYDGLPWARINEIVPLGLRNGSAHDAFQMPGTITPAQALQEGWVAPLDDLIPNFEEWKASFPPNIFFDGIHVFEGKTYTFPPTSNKRHDSLFLFNTELIERAGYDPATGPRTWDEFRDAARKITEQGRGRQYGVALSLGQPNRVHTETLMLARMAGLPIVGGATVNPLTGEHVFASEEVLSVVELFLSLQQDGSLFPGSSSLLAPQMWPRLPQEAVGMIFGGPWVVLAWQQEAPDFQHFGVADLPAPSAAGALPHSVPPVNLTDAIWVYGQGRYQTVAGDVLSYLGSPEGQMLWTALVAPGQTSLFPDVGEELRAGTSRRAQDAIRRANEAGIRPDSPQVRRAAELAEEMIFGPDPIVRNPDVQSVNQEIQALSPDFAATVQGIMIGELTNPRQALLDLQDRAERELDRAIEAARAKGAQVSRDDWVFPNFDPARNYKQEDYGDL
jgi:multiple sugar transport system substrate-binding protein